MIPTIVLKLLIVFGAIVAALTIGVIAVGLAIWSFIRTLEASRE